ncbi:DUF4034 domain-containing protein [Dyella terrae]|uniref:DUF4034 domain-containing protein n=1 Tax=Dyella terrae TaxID=522259 RepID=UPI001EFC40C2|nr:DUF4034 domain-containing protein [Dyella terrae]ULU27393.1 DUF4034 protein [Dyella terrae]
MASRVLWLLAAGGLLIGGAAGLAVYFGHVDPAPAPATAFQPPKARPMKVAFSPEEFRQFLDAARKAEAIADPLQRCLAYPDPPGTHWSANTAAAYCHYLLAQEITEDAVRQLIEHGQVSELQSRLASIESAALSDPQARDRLDGTFNIVFANGSSDMRSLMDAWKRQSPDNAFALAASGTAYVAMAQAQRGSEYADKTPQDAFDAMHRLLEQARSDLDRAATLDPKLTVSYAQMLHVGRMDSDPAYAGAAAKRALSAAPASYAIYARLISMSQPKWGGSVALMDHLIDLSQKHVAQNPLLGTLLSERGGGQQRVEDCQCDEFAEAELYRQVLAEVPTLGVLMSAGWAAQERSHMNLSVVYRSELLRFNPRELDHREARVFGLIDTGQVDWALEEGNALVKLAPRDENAYDARGAAYQATGDTVHAAADFEEALRIAPSDAWTLSSLGDIYVQVNHDWAKGWDIANRLIQEGDYRGWMLRADIQKAQPRDGLEQTIDDFVQRYSADPSKQVFVERMQAMRGTSVNPAAAKGRNGS